MTSAIAKPAPTSPEPEDGTGHHLTEASSMHHSAVEIGLA